MSGFIAVGFFLISLSFGLIIYSLWSRIALRYFRVSPLTELGRLIAMITNPLVRPLHLLLRQEYKPGQKYDWIAFIVLVCAEMFKIICLSFLAFYALMPLPFILLYTLADLIIQACNLLFYAILIRVIMSYVNPHWQNPFADLLGLITAPLLKQGRRIIPVVAGFDFSPMVIILLLEIITLFIKASLPWRFL